MKKISCLPTLLTLVVTTMLSACGSGGQSQETTNEQLVGSHSFSFPASIQPDTLAQQPSLFLFSRDRARNRQYQIGTQAELDAFNQADGNPVALSELNVYTYFLITAPWCTGSYRYTGHSYQNGTLTINVDEYQPTAIDSYCPAVIADNFLMFRARR